MRHRTTLGGSLLATAAALSVATATPASAAGEHVRNDGSSVVPITVTYDFSDGGGGERILDPGVTLVGTTFSSGETMNLNFARVPGGFRAEVRNSEVGVYTIDRCDRLVGGHYVEGQDAHVALVPGQANIIAVRNCPPAVPPA